MSDAVFLICPEVTAVLAEVFCESKPRAEGTTGIQLGKNLHQTKPFPGSVASFACTSLCLHREVAVRVA